MGIDAPPTPNENKSATIAGSSSTPVAPYLCHSLSTDGHRQLLSASADAARIGKRFLPMSASTGEGLRSPAAYRKAIAADHHQPDIMPFVPKISVNGSI